MKIVVPDGYTSEKNFKNTQIAIKQVKDYFQKALARRLNLTRVSAPLFVEKSTGINDNLNGIERPVEFDALEHPDDKIEIVQSLAKWKRMALKEYGFSYGEGLYTDMNAIRRDEETDNIHSIYVDQWDWEKIIDKDERNIDTLKTTVKLIYAALRDTERYIYSEYEEIKPILPEEITFVTSQELEDEYPDLTPKQRENTIARLKKAVFIIGIGNKLKSGERHDGRAPDYDDWSLNGDIVVYYPILDMGLELSSMGIRVDEESLKKQLIEAGCPERADLPFQKALLAGELPYTIGGGIGQSRICMFFLRKAHIGEIQSSVWPREEREFAAKNQILLL